MQKNERKKRLDRMGVLGIAAGFATIIGAGLYTTNKTMSQESIDFRAPEVVAKTYTDAVTASDGKCILPANIIVTTGGIFGNQDRSLNVSVQNEPGRPGIVVGTDTSTGRIYSAPEAPGLKSCTVG
ncbi:MAG: hypothetical protein WCD70_10565 [Alphaproteobacteria bacterium]